MIVCEENGLRTRRSSLHDMCAVHRGPCVSVYLVRAKCTFSVREAKSIDLCVCWTLKPKICDRLVDATRISHLFDKCAKSERTLCAPHGRIFGGETNVCQRAVRQHRYYRAQMDCCSIVYRLRVLFSLLRLTDGDDIEQEASIICSCSIAESIMCVCMSVANRCIQQLK